MNLIPLTDYDPNPRAIIQPDKHDHDRPVPERGVLCFFFDLLAEMVAAGQLVQIGAENSEMGEHPFYAYTAETPTGVPHSWFVALAPVEQPRFAIAVIVEYGGERHLVTEVR